MQTHRHSVLYRQNECQTLHLCISLLDQGPSGQCLCSRNELKFSKTPKGTKCGMATNQLLNKGNMYTNAVIWKNIYLTTLWGVKFDSHKWLTIAPVQVDLNFTTHSDLSSVCSVNPTEPTNTKCWTCSGCCVATILLNQNIAQQNLITWFCEPPQHCKKLIWWKILGLSPVMHILLPHNPQRSDPEVWTFPDFVLFAMPQKNR